MSHRRTRTHRKLTFESLDCRRMLAGNIFHYADDPFDVNMDGRHNMADLRVVMLDLMEHGSRELQIGDAAAGHYMVDVSDDGLLNSQDVRQVFAMLTTVEESPSDSLTDVVADDSLVTRQIYIAEGGPGMDMGGGMGTNGGGSLADFDALIQLIQNTIDPDSWEAIGTGMQLVEFEENLSLIVTQTQEVQDQIADLLNQLRNLQDLQVNIEVRFITLNDNFFEQIGIDFDFDIDDNTQPGQVPDDGGPIVIIGQDPDGNPTVDFDLSFAQGSFGATVPQFGGFDAATATNFGFAILSDIEAFFLIQAAQGDQPILQAPVVTLFDNQVATVIDSVQRPFVTSVIPVVGGSPEGESHEDASAGGRHLRLPLGPLFNQINQVIDSSVGFQPVITTLPENPFSALGAIISADRRYIRLPLDLTTNPIGDVETFNFQGPTIQLPNFTFTTITTTVSVPDGGTILLGGIQRLTEGRNETGVPILNRLPYINRLFQNVGISRDANSLMLMVTPRIIIQLEEE